MNTKLKTKLEEIQGQLQHASEDTIDEILELLKHRNAEDEEDIIESRKALEEAKVIGTIPWSEVKRQAGL